MCKDSVVQLDDVGYRKISRETECRRMNIRCSISAPPVWRAAWNCDGGDAARRNGELVWALYGSGRRCPYLRVRWRHTSAQAECSVAISTRPLLRITLSSSLLALSSSLQQLNDLLFTDSMQSQLLVHLEYF